jgi:hypothetical protein
MPDAQYQIVTLRRATARHGVMCRMRSDRGNGRVGLGNTASLRGAAHVLRLHGGELEDIGQIFAAVVMGENSQLPRFFGDVMGGRMRLGLFAASFGAARRHE